MPWSLSDDFRFARQVTQELDALRAMLAERERTRNRTWDPTARTLRQMIAERQRLMNRLRF